VNVAEGWKGGLQEPSGLNARTNAERSGRVTTGAMVKNGPLIDGPPEVGVGSLCMDGETAMRICRQSPVGLVVSDWVHSYGVWCPPGSETGGAPRGQGYSRPPNASRVSALNTGTSTRAPGRRCPASCQAQ
jgi:hypothetical protein